MKLSHDLLADVRRMAREKEKTITPEELFRSRVFEDYVNNLVSSITGRYGVRRVKAEITARGPEETACTTGDKLVVNTECGLAAGYTALLSRFMAVMGLVFHECGHILFMDFDAENEARRFISEGILFGNLPGAETPEEELARAEMLEALQVPAYRPIFARVYGDLSNIVADPHDEAKMTERFGPYISQGIAAVVEALRNSCAGLEKMQEEGWKPLEIMYSVILQTARFGEALSDDIETAILTNEYAQKIPRFAPDLEAAKTTDDPWVKYTRLNRIVLILWPYIRQMLKESGRGAGQVRQDDQAGEAPENPRQQGNGTSQTQGDTGQAPERVRQVVDSLTKAAQGAGMTRTPENRQSSGAAKQVTKEAKTAGKAAGEAGSERSAQMPGDRNTAGSAAQNGTGGGENAFRQLVAAAARQQAEEETEKELASEINTRIRAVDRCSAHEGVPLDVTRIREITDADIRKYEKMMAEVRPYSERSRKLVREALRDRKEGYTRHHRLFGKILEADQAYRPDRRCYADRKLPQELPDMSVCILVDHSGSMRGRRIRESMRAAMLLHDFCVGLGIPVQVAGHRTSGETVQYIVYTDYRSAGSRDRYRIARMSAAGSNRDGMALEIAEAQLAERPESVKILFIISDGQPAHRGYSGEGAAEDIRSVVRRYRKCGVKTIACAIGDDKDLIRAIYEDGFLDISDLSGFPKQLVRLIRKRILSSV